MTDRRSRQAGGDALGYNRMSERFEAAMAALTERLEGFADQMDHKFKRVNRDLAQGEQDRASMRTQIAELSLAFGELREIIALHEAEATRQAAEGGAAGAVQVAKEVAQEVATVTAEKTVTAAKRPSLTTLLTMLLVSLGGALTWGPKILGMITQALHLTGRGSD